MYNIICIVETVSPKVAVENGTRCFICDNVARICYCIIQQAFVQRAEINLKLLYGYTAQSDTNGNFNPRSNIKLAFNMNHMRNLFFHCNFILVCSY